MRKRQRGAGDRRDTAPRVSLASDGLATSFIAPSRDFLAKWSKKPGPRPFSLHDEARHTQRHNASHLDNKYRLKNVAFISAGASSNENLNDTEIIEETAVSAWNTEKPVKSKAPPERSMANLNLSGPSEVLAKGAKLGSVSTRTRPSTTTPTEEPLPTKGNSFFYIDRQGWKDRPHTTHLSSKDKSAPAMDDSLFFVDLEGSKDLAHKPLPKPTLRRSPSPTGSTSSEEVLLFTGRENSKGKKRSLDAFLPLTESKVNPVTVVDPVGSGHPVPTHSPDKLAPRAQVKPLIFDTSNAASRGAIGEYNSSMLKPSNGPPGRMKSRAAQKSQNDAILDDYIANMDAEAMADIASQATLAARQLETMETSGWEDEPEASDERLPAESIISFSETWDSEDLQGFDDLSTSEEILGEVKRVCSKRLRPSGVQYLVVYEGCTIDDARWIHVNALASRRALENIQSFETEQSEKARYIADSASEESDEDAQIAKDVQDDMDDYLNEQDLISGTVKHMTDEQIARLLAKQEELGIGSDELLLFDGGSELPQKHGRRNPGRLRQEFSSASLLDDALDQDPYNGFDVMDTERPSLKKKSKGRRATMPIELSDSEREQSFQAAWVNDRSKKKKRKQEREELRTQGLLGKKGKVDMKAKYSRGMTMAQVADEVKAFLNSTDESLSLPPMGQRERKLVHELANVFWLKSKSTGNGTTRFTTLIRTKRTVAFHEAIIPKRISRGFGIFLPRKDNAAKKGATVTRVARGGGFSTSAVTYRDGDVVGASAPELGLENRGRNMLEKMGWSTGTALGALNNKGIMQPVIHIVKNSKAGLG